jgi:succinylarginine dihydrolase
VQGKNQKDSCLFLEKTLAAQDKSQKDSFVFLEKTLAAQDKNLKDLLADQDKSFKDELRAMSMADKELWNERFKNLDSRLKNNNS